MGSVCSCCCERPKGKHKSSKNKNKGNAVNTDSEDENAVFTDGDEERGQLSTEEAKLKAELIEKQKKAIKKTGNSSYIDNTRKGRKGMEKQTQEFEALKRFLDKRARGGQNNYRVICGIGSGRYAEVFKAYGLKEHKFVAIKVINLKKAEDNYRQNFLPKEVRILRKCKHNNIVKMYEIAQSGCKVYMIMEFAPNGTLTDWLKENGAFTEVMAHLTFPPIVDGIHHMHSRRIAHRDLKLENILLANDYNPKISDFSYAIELRDLKDGLSDQFCGSLPYFSPEILQRLPHDPLISDIWSLGVCFYIMLNDGLPFRLGDDSVMLEKQLKKEWKFKNKVELKLSEELKSMIRSMLEPDAQKRITSAGLINHPWIRR